MDELLLRARWVLLAARTALVRAVPARLTRAVIAVLAGGMFTGAMFAGAVAVIAAAVFAARRGIARLALD
ncbi:MAG TPA: hypothetical protein PKC48_09995, partial [Sphingorhabdus sp.]|nr:hypothetical protein [Sphingorhabdus sp.]